MRFGVVVADPPWAFGDSLSMSDTPRGSEANYATLTAKDIAGLPVGDVLDDPGLVALWCPAALLTTGLDTLRAWGVEHKQVWVWVKTAKGVREVEEPQEVPLAFGMGRLARNACELVLVGTRGKIYDRLANRSIRNVFFAPHMKHSAKPECVQDALDRMFPTLTKLELFARRQRPGWACTGMECPGVEEDVRAFLSRVR